MGEDFPTLLVKPVPHRIERNLARADQPHNRPVDHFLEAPGFDLEWNPKICGADVTGTNDLDGIEMHRSIDQKTLPPI
jgi:hypothetical protein